MFLFLSLSAFSFFISFRRLPFDFIYPQNSFGRSLATLNQEKKSRSILLCNCGQDFEYDGSLFLCSLLFNFLAEAIRGQPRLLQLSGLIFFTNTVCKANLKIKVGKKDKKKFQDTMQTLKKSGYLQFFCIFFFISCYLV